jgi:hypothetical protein
MKENHVSIWWLIGLQLTIFGVLITGSGIYCCYVPPANSTVLADLHPAIWWGIIMLVLGLFYTFKFWPEK